MATDGATARRLVRILAEEPAPNRILESWTEHRPEWLTQAGWDTQLAAAELAGAYGVPRLQVDLFIGLAEQQCPPRELWVARAVFAEVLMDDQPAPSETLARLSSLGPLEHPYARAVAAMFDSRFDDARQALREWDSQDPADRAVKALSSLQLALGNPSGEFAEPDAVARALAVSRDLLGKGWFAGVALWRARQLTQLARLRGTKILFGDLREAQEIALHVRQDRRAFRGDSASAAAAACEAAAMRGDLDFVLRTGLPIEHGGDATDAEFRHADVALQVAMAAVQLQRFDIADLATANVTSPFQRKLVEALSAEVQQQDSAPRWRDAVDLAGDDRFHLVQALSGLARTGALDLPRLAELRAAQPDAAAEIQATAEIHAGNYDRSIASLRIQRRESITAAITLAEAYRSMGDIDSAARTLLDAADDFSDPHLRLQAAIIHARAGQKEQAKSLVTDLIQDRDPDWPEFTDVLRFTAQLALDEPDLDLAVKYCRQILCEEPGDSSTRWSLVNSLIVLDQVSEAWDSLRDAPEVLLPDSRVQGQMWVELHRRFSEPATLIRGGLRLLRMFRDDEELNALILVSVIVQKPSNEPVPADLLAEYHQELELFFERWPDSPKLRRIRTADDELLIQALTESVRLTPERLAERNRLNREFYRSEKPLVLLAQYTGRTYSEILIRRGLGVLPVVHPDARESAVCQKTVRVWTDQDVAIDASAIVVLSTLPREIQRIAMAVFRRVLTTEEVARDARQYEDDLGQKRGVLYYNADTDGPGFAEPTDDETAMAKSRLAAVQGLIASLWRRPIQPTPSRGMRALGTHASVAHLGASEGAAVWCDDATTRLTLRGMGIATFSTVAVLEHLLADGAISAISYHAAVDTLVRERVGNFDLDLSRIVRLAREEEWHVSSTASCLAQPQAWTDPADAAVLVRQLLEICHRENPDQVAAWLQAAVFGAVMRCSNTRAAVELGSMLLAANLVSLQARGDLARKMVLATRAAFKTGLPVDNPANIAIDPLPIAAQQMRTLLLANPSIATDQVFPVILDYLGALAEQDIRTVTAAILANDR
jgi:hypothetical protein